MGQVMEVKLSCYLVLPITDGKIRLTQQPHLHDPTHMKNKLHVYYSHIRMKVIIWPWKWWSRSMNFWILFHQKGCSDIWQTCHQQYCQAACEISRWHKDICMNIHDDDNYYYKNYYKNHRISQSLITVITEKSHLWDIQFFFLDLKAHVGY